MPPQPRRDSPPDQAIRRPGEAAAYSTTLCNATHECFGGMGGGRPYELLDGFPSFFVQAKERSGQDVAEMSLSDEEKGTSRGMIALRPGKLENGCARVRFA